jgi:hypothetical protein
VPSSIIRLVLLGITIGAALPSVSFTKDPEGRVCVAPAPQPGVKSFDYDDERLPDLTYTVQIDDLHPVTASRAEGIWISGLALDQSHLAILRANGNQMASFRFSFTSWADVPVSDLCLYLYQPHNTWQLWPASRPACRCE